jgi:hypothetical protein
MRFHRSGGLTESCPVKHAQTQIDDAGIQAQEFILESNFFFGASLYAKPS